MAPISDQNRQRAHAERMLARAERRSRQALKLVEKWKARPTDLDRESVEARQTKLWADDHQGGTAAHEAYHLPGVGHRPETK